MENKETMECSIMEEVREMRRKISAEFEHDFKPIGCILPKSRERNAEVWEIQVRRSAK